MSRAKGRKSGNESTRGRRAEQEAPAEPPAPADPWLAAGALQIEPPRRSRAAWICAVAAAVITFMVFIPALDNEFVDWDDTGVLLDNPDWRGLGGAQLAWMFTTNHYGHYQPVTWLTYGLDYVVWEMNPRGYHLTNNLFHAANAVLMFLVSMILLGRAFAGDERWRGPVVAIASLLAALLFSLHPLRVESVAWVTERRDLVSAFFILLTVLTYLKSVAPGEPRRFVWLGISIAIYVVSMISKVGGAPLPVVLLLLDWYPLRRFGFSPRTWNSPRAWAVYIEKLPYFVIALGFAYATVVQQTGRWLVTYEMHAFDARVAQAFYGLVFYPLKTFAPFGLLPLYELHLPLHPFEKRFVVSAVIVGVAGLAALFLRRRLPGLIVALLVMAAMLGPLLGFFQNGPQIVADRYSYLSTHGIILLIVSALVLLVARTGGGRIRSGVLAAAGAVLVIPLAILTWQQCNVWQDTTTLWAYNVKGEPENSFANNGHGYMLMQARRHAEAVPYLRKAIERRPDNREAHLNLWNALEELGSEPELVAGLRQSADGAPMDILALAHYRLGNIDRRNRRYDASLVAYRKSLDFNPADARVYVNMGLSLVQLNRSDDAKAAYEMAIRLNAGLYQAHYNLGNLLRNAGDDEGALREYETVLQLRPDHANSQRYAAECRQRLGR